MGQKEVVAKLKGLREEIEKHGDVEIIDLPTTMAIALSDVCHALGLSQAEHDEVVGEEVAKAVEEWKSARIWQPAERGTTTGPVAELAAVSV